jgi:hypothetical protein
MSPKKNVTAEDAEEDLLFAGSELLPPFNVAQMVEDLIEDFGDVAADHARLMVGLARQLRKWETAEDYELVYRLILERQGERQPH